MRHPVIIWHSFVWMLFLTDLFRVNFSVSIWRKTNRHLRVDFAHYCLCDRNVLRIDRRNLQLSTRHNLQLHVAWGGGELDTASGLLTRLLTQCLEALRHLGWSFAITVPLLSVWTCRLKISNGGDTEFSQRKYILHEKWGIILQHCYYRLAINANLIYTLHTLCIEEYNKK